MKIDLDHLHHWMRAIRESQDPNRTLDAFWKGQLSSKEWLIESIRPFVKEPVSVDIHGGWVGVLASMLFQSDLPIMSIRNIDIDPTCSATAISMNQMEYEQGRFDFVLDDMCNVESTADIVINTSCEHITQEQYERWLANTSDNSLIVLQSNNYKIDEHIRISNSIEEFQEQSRLAMLWQGQLSLPLYDRYMIIGKKSV